MQQVLFRIPFPLWDGIPIYGFGAMLVVALFVGIYVASRRARKNDVNPEHVQDVVFWVVIAGIIGARVVHMIQFRDEIQGNVLVEFFMFWKGGLVFYGALIGGVLGYVLAWHLVMKKHKLSAWKLADIIVPSVALGLCFGRVGCLLNGCCYGAVAPPGYPSLHFPNNSYAGKALRESAGDPTRAAGFTLDDKAEDRRTVEWVDPETPAASVGGLKQGDVITHIDGLSIPDNSTASNAMRQALTRTEVIYTVVRNGQEVRLKPFYIQTLELGQNARKFSVIAGLEYQEKEPDRYTVTSVVPHGPAAEEGGVQQGDVIVKTEESLQPKDELAVTVDRDGQKNVELPRFAARTVGLQPTQVYESVSTFLIFLLLTAYFPLRRRDGELFVLFLVLYPLHRFLNEMLRNDTQPVFLGMTLSQNISLLVLVAAAVVAVIVFRRPVQYPSAAATPAK